MSSDNYKLTEEKESSQEKRRSHVILVFVCVLGLIIAIVVGLLVHYLTTTKDSVKRSQVVVECARGAVKSKDECVKIGCIWTVFKDKRIPKCHHANDRGYEYVTHTNQSDGIKFSLRHKGAKSYHGTGVDEIFLNVTFISENIIRIQITPTSDTYYEIPDQFLPAKTVSVRYNETSYEVDWNKGPPFGISVRRKNSKITVFNTTIPGLTISEQYLEITTKLPSSNIYGLGENNQEHLKLDTNWKSWPIFVANKKGAHPFYLNVEKNGMANGVFLRNSNAMDVTLQPDPFPALTYRVIGGILDFYVFVGPSPKDVIMQYTKIVGRPLMPARWSLGLHLGGTHDNYANIEDLITRNVNAKIPFDVIQTGSGNSASEFPMSTEIKTDLLALIKKHRTKAYALAFTSGLAYNRSYAAISDGEKKDIFIKNDTGKLYMSKIDGTDVVYPDYTKPATLR